MCVFPVCRADIFLLFNLLKWIHQLGDCHGHRAIIVADAGLDWDYCVQAITLAEQSFDHAQLVTNPEPVAGWIPGSNSLFRAAATYCQTQRIPRWLWLEPDAVPLKPGWLDALDKAATENQARYLACVYLCGQGNLPQTMMSGIAVYPANTLDDLPPGNDREAFDVQLSRNVTEHAGKHTPLIQNFWGQLGLPPTFRLTKRPADPKHFFTLDKLSPDAVLFHRSKDGTLIDLLRKNLGVPGDLAVKKLLVVLPVCLKDVDLLLKCLAWMTELDGQNQFPCLISHDTSLGSGWLYKITEAAKRAFSEVHENVYPRPFRETWPDACNVAFQSAARNAQTVHNRPWLFHEADCVPLKPNWLDSLWLEYQHCGKPIMGPVIQGAGHMNGTAIYPANFPTVSPDAMNASNSAWDTAMTADIVGQVHDCSRLFCHRWGMVNGSLHPSQGPAAHFSSPLSVQQWLPPDAVLFHRCKDGSLIDQLRAMRK